MSKPGNDDADDRAAIEARRARLVALAMAGLLSTTACGDDGKPSQSGPQPCLSAAPPHSTPSTCLTAAVLEPPDAGPPQLSASSTASAPTAPPDAGADGGTDAGTDAGAARSYTAKPPVPMPCLTQTAKPPPPPPQPCLTPVRRK